MSKYDEDRLTGEEVEKHENRNKVCAYCDKQFFIPYMVNLSKYAYKQLNPKIKGKNSIKNHGDVLWFCSWSCLSKFRKAGNSNPRRDARQRGMSITDRIRNHED